MHLRNLAVAVLSLVAVGLLGCGNSLNSDEKARLAYIGLDGAIQKSLTLGFAGFNAASSANIPAQTANGSAAGTLTITGQVDQGSSANKGMRLKVGMTGYTDGKVQIPGQDQQVSITYDTPTDTALQPALTLQLKDIPTGTLTGTVVGAFKMTGDLQGDVTLNLAITGQLEDDGTGKVRRKAGNTTITGTAVSPDGTYNVNLTL